MSTLPFPSEMHQPIHRYSYPLGGPRWLEAEYHKVKDGYRWLFALGGEMKVDDWPQTIAFGLAGVSRFGHLTPYRYSVGRHSYLLARYVRTLGYGPRATILAALHDAPECLGVGDMNTNLKRAIGHAARSYEDDLLRFILDGLGVVPTEEDEHLVHHADKVFGAAEARLMDMQNGVPWSVTPDNSIYKYLEEDGLADTSTMQTVNEWFSEFNPAMKELTPKGNTNDDRDTDVSATEPSDPRPVG